MTTTRMTRHPATTAETDEAITTTLLGGEVEDEGKGDGEGPQFSEEILSSGSTG